MYIVSSHSFNALNICTWHECTGCHSPRQFSDRSDAALWLGVYRTDISAMSNLRRILSLHDYGLGLSRVDDDQVVLLVAALLASRQLLVCGEHRRLNSGVLTEAAAEARRPLEQIMKDLRTTNADFQYRGQFFRVVSTYQWASMGGSSARYQILPRDQASTILAEIATALINPGTERRALEAAVSLLTDDAKTEIEHGILLLRGSPGTSGRSTSDSQLPFTPSQQRTSTHWIQVRVIDERSGRPVNGVRLRINTPNGSGQYGVTSGRGTIRIDGLPPGICDVTCEIGSHPKLALTRQFVALGGQPAGNPGKDHDRPLEGSALIIATIDEHRVATGESIASLAKEAGLSWQALANFNWDTDQPKKINERLRDFVGCTKKTRDARNYVFDDSDEPGIVCIPRSWELQGLATDKEHVIRVQALTQFHIILETVDGAERLPKVKARVKLADGQTKSVSLGKGGVARIKDPPPGKVEVTYEDLDDVKAKTLAAEACVAFQKRDTQEIYRILKHSPTLVRRAVSEYDLWFNTLHGQGLVNDLYAEFTDPKALRLVVGLLARAGLTTREKAEFVTLGSQAGDHFITAAPELRAVIPGARITYSCLQSRDMLEAPGAGFEFEWYCLNDRATVQRDGGGQVFFGPKKALWEEASWSLIGDHALVCRVRHRNASGERGAPTYYEYPQAVEKVEAVVSRHLGRLKSEELPDPHQVLSSARRMLEDWRAAEQYAKAKGFPPLSSEAQKLYDERKQQFELFGAKLEERAGGKHLNNKHFPVRAVHTDKNGQSMTLRVSVRRALAEPLKYAPGIDPPQWELVDWTNPAHRAATGVYSGSGTTARAAIQDAFESWDSGFNGNRYPKGQIAYELPFGLLGEPISGHFDTTGTSALDTIAKALGHVATVAGVAAMVALCLVPEPAASKALAATIYLSIFAGTASAVINIGQRYDEGLSNWREDGLDTATIVSNCLGLAWMRGATLTHAGRTYILLGRAGADGVQGVFIVEGAFHHYSTIMEDPGLSPDERSSRLVKFFAQLAVTGTMMYINFKGTKADIDNLKGAGKTQVKIEEITDPKKKIEIEDEAPSLEGHTDDKTKKTKIGTEITKEHIDSKEPLDFKDKFPPDDKFWERYKITDSEVDLIHRGDDGTPFRFNAKFKDGAVTITVITKRTNAGKKVFSTRPDGTPCLVAEELYAMMFKHFKKAGHKVTAWEGPFAWDNYDVVKKAMIGPPPLTPEEAILEGITAKKYWLPWSQEQGLKPNVVMTEDMPQHGLLFFRVEFVPK